MDFIELKKRYRKDDDYPDRTFDLQMYRRVLEGTLYDVLPYPFFKSFSPSVGSGSVADQMVPLCNRRPSIRSRLAKVVVDQSVSLVFGEGRFPVIQADGGQDKETTDILNEIAASRHLEWTMLDAATKGSVGSAVIFLKMIEGKLFFSADYPEYYTPIFDADDPDYLSSLMFKCKKTGEQLRDMGYDNLETEEVYWFVIEWTKTQEIYYVPVKIKDYEKDKKLTVDKKNTTEHGFGFVPAVWVINLPGGNSIDGLCTFKDGIDTNIELDYQLSQAGRGLKYSAEPLLVIRGGLLSMEGGLQIKPGDALVLDEKGDAKHVEISGESTKAVLEFCKALRDIVLENTHGNRQTPEKNHTVQSGKAMEMLHMSLIWLSSRLRISYGEVALLKLMQMVVKINQNFEIKLNDNIIKTGQLKKSKLSLNWPAWFPSTGADRWQDAQTITKLKDAYIISQKTAVTSIASEYDIVDIEAEIAETEREHQEFLEQSQPAVNENINA